MRNVLMLLLLLTALQSSEGANAQTPQGTAFTYQGLLNKNGAAVNGSTNMVFDLFDAAVTGNHIGPSLSFTAATSNAVAVHDGLFTVVLDFGAAAFMTLANDQRFLQITVNGTILTPRSQIQNAPYGLQSQTAELAYSVSNASIGTAQIIPTQVQRRIAANCASGSAISTVNQDGTVACQTAGPGTITSVTANPGLTGGGSSGGVSIGPDYFYIQKRIYISCTEGNAIKSVDENGYADCAPAYSYPVVVTDPNGFYNDDAITGISTTVNRFGVYASSTATSGTGNGVYGESDSPNGVGVSGYADSGIGVAGSTHTGLAGKFIGDVSVTGSISKGGGSFKIDHPLDPENKYLFHSFVESPDMKNIYDGVATLDASGSVWVALPDYFEALNRDFRYQLTALGQPAPSLYVANEIAGNHFRIAGGAPGQRVSWQVTGTRQDAFANKNRVPVEVDKAESERGKYLYPTAFGKPASQGIDYDMIQVAQRAAAHPTAPHP